MTSRDPDLIAFFTDIAIIEQLARTLSDTRARSTLLLAVLCSLIPTACGRRG